VIIVGDETLGIAKVEDTRFPIYGQVPVPSVLDFQIDTIAIHLMLKLIKSVVSRLKKIIYGRRNKEKWYEVYLTCFILLGCLEKVYSLQLGYMGMGDAMVCILNLLDIRAINANYFLHASRTRML
jgi:hypothetical protein